MNAQPSQDNWPTSTTDGVFSAPHRLSHRLHTSRGGSACDLEIPFVLETLTSHKHVKGRSSARSPRFSSCLTPSIPAISLMHLTIILLQVRPLFAEQRVHPHQARSFNPPTAPSAIPITFFFNFCQYTLRLYAFATRSGARGA